MYNAAPLNDSEISFVLHCQKGHKWNGNWEWFVLCVMYTDCKWQQESWGREIIWSENHTLKNSETLKKKNSPIAADSDISLVCSAELLQKNRLCGYRMTSSVKCYPKKMLRELSTCRNQWFLEHMGVVLNQNTGRK